MFELHVYGPAWGLPSVDVKCLAAIALLNSSLRRDDWALVASNNPLVSPFDELPALKLNSKAEDVWIAGFRNIAQYIKSSCVNGTVGAKPDFKFDLSEQETADSEAYLSFLESRGFPLLDLSLYVSSDNYTTVTRSTLSEILPWPQSWTVPQRLRSAAKKRSEHLGLSRLDVDATREKELKKENEGISAAIPQSLRIPKKSVSSLLGSSAEAARFRLEAVTADFFEPLEAQLADKSYLLGEQATVLDCLALAVFSQILVDNLPQPWLKEALEKYSKLHKWTLEHRSRILASDSTLPWKQPVGKTWSHWTQDVIDTLAESMPITLRPNQIRTEDAQTHRTFNTRDSNTMENSADLKHRFRLQERRSQAMLRTAVTACLTSAGLIGLLTYMGILTVTWPSFRRAPRTRHGFGEAGSFLGLS